MDEDGGGGDDDVDAWRLLWCCSSTSGRSSIVIAFVSGDKLALHSHIRECFSMASLTRGSNYYEGTKFVGTHVYILVASTDSDDGEYPACGTVLLLS